MTWQMCDPWRAHNLMHRCATGQDLAATNLAQDPFLILSWEAQYVMAA
jgi:hypothetical protein